MGGTSVNSLILNSIKDLKQSNDRGHEEIITHQKSTNGRVRRLELWKAGIIGGVSVLSIFASFLLYGLVDAKNNYEEREALIVQFDNRLTLLEDANKK